MLDAALIALENLAAPMRLLFLFFGVIMGLGLGAIPGLGGLVGLAILLPFTFDMDPYMAMAIVIGLISVTSTSDTIPSVLFGVPGTSASQATILDGHPMAKKGEAGRAFGAAYMASLLGGLLGAVTLAVSIPILRPIVLAFGSPEFFMMGMLGISMVAVLSGNAPIKGLIAGALGLSIGMVGMDPQTGIIRWSFNSLYLWDGLPLVPVALGIFAIPEIVDLMIKGTRIADVPAEAVKGVTVGIKDSFRHWFLVLRCSAVGVWVGATPGLGAAIVDWFAYGHAKQTEKGAAESFGSGDVRGVIAPESANNAKEGGALIPTIAFGVPGSASMALLLGVMTIHGLTPGTEMLTKHLDVTYTMIWSLAIANVFGTGLCLLFTNALAKVAVIRIQLLAPLVISIVFLASFHASSDFGDLWSLLFFSALGWFMKRFGWPRPPIVLGLVLSRIIEGYLFISLNRFGSSWVSRPFVIGIAVLICISLFYGYRMTGSGGRRRVQSMEERGPLRCRIHASSLFSLANFMFFGFAMVTAYEWEIQARLFPWVIGVPGLLLSIWQFAKDSLYRGESYPFEEHSGIMDLPVDRSVPLSVVWWRASRAASWILGLFFAVWLLGFIVSVPLFVLLYIKLEARAGLGVSLIAAASMLIFIVGVFHLVLSVPWPQGAFPHVEESLLQLIDAL